jgi:hypothetical protein
MKAHYIIRAGDSLSQFLNVLFLNGHPNESLSGRAWRTGSFWRHVIDALLFFDPDHCEMAHRNDMEYCKCLQDSYKS